MPNVVEINTAHYDLLVWSKDVSKSQARLAKTLDARNQELLTSLVLFSPPLAVLNNKEGAENRESFCCDGPQFFENKQYEFEFIFKVAVSQLQGEEPAILHRLRQMEEAFHYSERTHSLRATINTANDIGWFKIELVYFLERVHFKQAFSFEVLPTKMDLATDLFRINQAIDNQFPLWRFSLAEKTQQQMRSVKKPHEDFLLLWFAQFESLWAEFLLGFKHIVNAPHSRLIETTHQVKMAKLKGRLSPRLEEQVGQARVNEEFNKRFSIDKKHLSVDTPENRFIKLVLKITINKLAKVNHLALQMKSSPDQLRLSDSFFATIQLKQNSLQRFQRQPLFLEIGEFKGFTKESLVLQQKPGYSKVYKCWQQLKHYLDLLAGFEGLSVRSISELYEIWCFLEVRRVLLDLDFKEKVNKRIPLENTGLQVTMKDGLAGQFTFTRTDGIELHLVHEPRFNTKGNPIKSWLVEQKPDIYLEAIFPDGQAMIWLFDAKYRIENKSSDEESDWAPNDAINQMHRYRDALIHQRKDGGAVIEKSRPVYGAYALYPGFYNQSEKDNPYQESIDEIGIGAFSLLPSEDNSGSIWLKSFLSDKLGVMKFSYKSRVSSDQYYIEEPSQIAFHGTKNYRVNDLVIAANQLGPNRCGEYIKAFRHGNAEFYHTRVYAFERQEIEPAVIKQARFLSVAVTESDGSGEMLYVYPIVNAFQKPRNEITVKQSGTEDTQSTEQFWLFTLGKSLMIKTAVHVRASEHFQLKVVSLDELSTNCHWDELSFRFEKAR